MSCILCMKDSHTNQLKNRLEEQSAYVAKTAQLQLKKKNLMDNLSQNRESLRSHLSHDFFVELWNIFWAWFKTMETLTKAWWCAMMDMTHGIHGKIMFSEDELSNMKWYSEELIKQHMKASIISSWIETNQAKITTAVDSFVAAHPEIVSWWVTVTWNNNIINLHAKEDAWDKVIDINRGNTLLNNAA